MTPAHSGIAYKLRSILGSSLAGEIDFLPLTLSEGFTMFNDPLRLVVFKPYAKGQGPVFRLKLWDTGQTGYGGKSLLRYQLIMSDGVVLFQGSDFGCSPLHAIDSDEAVKGIMSFLTLRPGDTDRD